MAAIAASSAFSPGRDLATDDFLWALSAMCRVHRVSFDASRVLQQFPPPYSVSVLVEAARALGLRARALRTDARRVLDGALPCLVALESPNSRTDARTGGPAAPADLGLLVRRDAAAVQVVQRVPHEASLSLESFDRRFAGEAIEFGPAPAASGEESGRRAFGFAWFVPELLRHKSAWRDVILASFALQLAALAVPLLTQVVIDKVVAHHTLNTLVAVALALGLFLAFSAIMSWGRQDLLLHAGNRIDVVLGSRVFAHLFALPQRYFESRPTGTLVARLQGIETIRQFLTGAAVILVLDLPFLAIFVAAMFHYDAPLALSALALITFMAVLSLAVAPLIRRRLDRQFLAGARNQAFLTEYVAGMETVKSMQLEPQLARRYGEQLSAYLSAGYATARVHNVYNVAMQALEQALMLGVLCLGALEVMRNEGFTVGMLIAFQMFASRAAQPLLRMAGLWQDFQQASVAVRRLADLMDAPAEPVSLLSERAAASHARVEIDGLRFRHSVRSAELFGGLTCAIEPGQCAIVRGPSGCGKSSLARLLQGLYTPEQGRIRLNGHDLRSLPVNELRAVMGVVPQEVVLFSGTVYDNLLLGNPHAVFEDVVQACVLAGIHESIEALPDGYQTPVGEHGAGLSGGQKQRVAIARALLRRPRLLLLDEATSQLDEQSAAAIVRTLNQLRNRMTIVVIAHETPPGLEVDVDIVLGAPEPPR